MAIEYTIEVDSAEVDRKLRNLQGLLLRWDEAMVAIGAAYKQYLSTKPFASRGSVFGAVWPDLQPAYKSWKARKYPGRPILVRSNALSRGFEFMSTTNSVRMFNKVAYFEKHQKGEGVPQRTSMAFNQELKLTASDIIAKDLQRKMQAI